MTVVIVLSISGFETARKISSHLRAPLHGRMEDCDQTISDFTEHLGTAFKNQNKIVFVGALGVLVRLIARNIRTKETDPPVVVVAEDGSAIIPVLGGHRGANSLARTIGKLFNTAPAITTASDIHFGIGLDDPPLGWHLASTQGYKDFLAQLLTGTPVSLHGNIPWISGQDIPINQKSNLIIKASEKVEKPDSSTLIYHPESLALGIGCERGTSPEEVINLVTKTLGESGLAKQSIAAIVSIDLKMDEPAINEAALWFKRPARFFTSERLEQETPRLKNPSEIVFSAVGCHGVAEAAALAAAGPKGKLITPKRRSQKATCAVAKATGIIYPNNVGVGRGQLYIIGTGPGAAEWRTPEIERLIKQSDDLIGYKFYLNLLGDLIDGKTKHTYSLGQESERVIAALNLASEGRKVSLVSSGDPGIYAMASLVFEHLENPDRPNWKQVKIIVAPGISAFQACAARIGAPLGNDFCAISLSNLMTPWNIIERRLTAALESDFVIVLYNPASTRRRVQIKQAIEIFRKYRSPDTPVAIGQSIGRTDENIIVTKLKNFDPSVVDMFTLVLIGNSQTRITDGYVFTPRGYTINSEVRTGSRQ